MASGNDPEEASASVTGLFRAGLLMCRIAFDVDAWTCRLRAELDVGPGVADHDAGCGRDVGELANGLLEKAGHRLAAVALVFVVRAEVEGVDVGAVTAQFSLEFSVDVSDVGRCVAVRVRCRAGWRRR